MKLWRTSENPVTGTVQVYKQSVVGALIGLLFVGGGTAAMAWGLLQGKLPFFLWIGCAFLVLMCLLFVGMLRSAMGPDNWVIKFDGSQLAFKFRSYLNRHFPPEHEVVAVFSASEFESVRQCTEERLVPGGKHKNSRERWVSLDFRLKHPGDAAKLAGAIREELVREAPKIGMGRTKHHHMPVRVVDGSTIRVSWSSTQDRLRPGIARALRDLGGAIRVEEALSRGARDYREMLPEDLDAFVTELAESGDWMKAGRVIREVHGLGLRESREFVDGLLQPPGDQAGQGVDNASSLRDYD